MMRCLPGNSMHADADQQRPRLGLERSLRNKLHFPGAWRLRWRYERAEDPSGATKKPPSRGLVECGAVNKTAQSGAHSIA